MVIGLCVYTSSDYVLKHFLQNYDVHQVTFLRTVFRLIPYMCFAFYQKVDPYSTKRVPEQIFRAFVATLVTYLFVGSYKFASVTDIAVIAYSSPLFIIPLSMWILSENVKISIMVAVIIGMLGVIIALRPDGDVINFGGCLATVGAFLAALNQILIRNLSKTENNISMLFYHNSLLFVISGIFAFFSWKPMEWIDIFPFFIVGIFTATGQYCIIQALRVTQVSNLAVFTYITIIPALLADWIIWTKLPDSYIIIGAILIISSNLYVLKKQNASN